MLVRLVMMTSVYAMITSSAYAMHYDMNSMFDIGIRIRFRCQQRSGGAQVNQGCLLCAFCMLQA